MTLPGLRRHRQGDSVNTRSDGFDVGIVEKCYLEFKNVIKSAPEVTFWGGQRFYDRYDIHPQDYFFLDTLESVAASIISMLGIGSLAIAYYRRHPQRAPGLRRCNCDTNFNEC